LYIFCTVFKQGSTKPILTITTEMNKAKKYKAILILQPSRSRIFRAGDREMRWEQILCGEKLSGESLLSLPRSTMVKIQL
jgi:hypothetical protein